jgi:flagellar hook-associated protein 1
VRLSTILNTANKGLSITQAGLDVVASNVSNADSIGYVRRSISNIEEITGGRVTGTRTGSVDRMLDRIVQRQLWGETSSSAYTQTRSDTLSALDRLYGAPGSTGSLNATFDRFTTSLSQLKNEPSNYATRRVVLDAAQDLATRLNDLSDGVQDLRAQAESGIDSAITRINGLLGELQTTNSRIVNGRQDMAKASLEDDRDRIVTELARYIDIKSSIDSTGKMTVITGSGTQIFDGNQALRFEFDKRAITSGEQRWDANAANRGVGTITLVDPSGGRTDAIANRLFRSGEVAAFVELRDKTLTQFQTQLDDLAGQMSSALSDTQKSTAVPGGFDSDMAGMVAGNTIKLDYTITPAGTKRSITFVRVDSAAALPLPAEAGGDINNPMVGIDFSGGPAAVAAQIQAALGGPFTVSNAGSVLRIVGSGTRTVDAMAARATNAALTNAGAGAAPEISMFVDGQGSVPYTGTWDEIPGQRVGFAQRITVNPSLLADQTRLVVFGTTPNTAQGDPTRPTLMLDRLTTSVRSFAPATGIGGSGQTYNGTIADFSRRVVESVGQQAENANRLNEGQSAALKAIESRYTEAAGVNVDTEMSHLIELQTAYAANARIITAAKEMMDLLMRA